MVNGFLLVNKPKGISSFEVIRKMKKIFTGTKIGHTGTLDLSAEGLLILAFGKATRLIKYMCLEPKIYEFSLCFGKQTDTLDSEGKVVFTSDIIPSVAEANEVCKYFQGEQKQLPPAFSAIKVKGKRAYYLARKGITPSLRERRIFISELSLLKYNVKEKIETYRVACSGGTYIRALARDIASKLGSVGYATYIKRISCGNFSLHNAIALDSVNSSIPLLPIRDALPHITTVEIDEMIFNKISKGMDISLDIKFQNSFLRYKKEIVALVEKNSNGEYHPSVVFCTKELKSEE
ncbi:MAG: tRNA pseudouridine(55) synthase TruB [Chitinispirillaceae bacterium]|nr:tRNA pseudouridine(55) synthase TruB [Chitinispirillaceae bacterium]